MIAVCIGLALVVIRGGSVVIYVLRGWGLAIVDCLVRGISGVRVGWVVPHRGDDDPAQRLRRVLVHEWLLRVGVDSSLVVSGFGGYWVPGLREKLNEFNIIMLSQSIVGFGILVEWCRELGIPCVLDVTEDVRQVESEWGIATNESRTMVGGCHSASVISCASSVLGEQYEKFGVTMVVRDIFEVPAVLGDKPSEFRAVWCGLGVSAGVLGVLYPVLEGVGVGLLTISDAMFVNPCGEHRVRARGAGELVSGSVALCPHPHWVVPGKSNCKVTQALSLGLPVLCSPLRSYTEVVDDGVNGFVCYSLEDWGRYLVILRNDPELCAAIGERGRESVERYNIDSVGLVWLGVIRRALNLGVKSV